MISAMLLLAGPANIAGDAALLEQFGSTEAPARGAFFPLSEAEKEEWRQKYKEPAPSETYRGPSADEIRQIPEAERNAAERYWLQDSIDTPAAIWNQTEAAYDAAIAEYKAGIAKIESERSELRKEQAESETGLAGAIKQTGNLVKYGGYAIGLAVLYKLLTR